LNEAQPQLDKWRLEMLKLKLAGIATTVLLLGAGAAHAAQSVFPSGVSEAAPFSFPATALQGIADPAQTATSVFPSAADEVAAFSFPAHNAAIGADRLDRTYGGAFPSSAIEVGSQL
jgi:hypothetical protein